MASAYSHLTDQELRTDIAAYRKALKEMMLSPVAVVAGEGRRVEFVGSAGRNDLKDELRNLVAELNQREGNHGPGGSLIVEIG